LPLKAATVRREAHKVLEDLPGWRNTVIGDMLSELTRLDERIAGYDKHITQMAQQNEKARQLMRLAGTVPPSSAAANVTSMPDQRSAGQPCSL
jgi:transposase